jgi:hypothetical protein
VSGIFFHGQADKIRLNSFQCIDIGVFPNWLTLVVFPKEDILLQMSGSGETQPFQQFPGALVFGVAVGDDFVNAA